MAVGTLIERVLTKICGVGLFGLGLSVAIKYMIRAGELGDAMLVRGMIGRKW